MYETYPKLSLGFVAMMLFAAFVLPAVMVFPSVGQTAAGLQIALLLWVLVVTRMILLQDQQTYFHAIRLPLAIFAIATALSFSPHVGVMEVITNCSFVPMLLGTAFGIAVLAAVGFLVAWNRLYLLPYSQGAAVVADLVMVAALANWVAPRQALSNGDLGRRALNALSFSLYIGTVTWMILRRADGSFHAVKSVISVLVQFGIIWLIYPDMERRLQPK